MGLNLEAYLQTSRSPSLYTDYISALVAAC
jgi:hypothetical protein